MGAIRRIVMSLIAETPQKGVVLKIGEDPGGGPHRPISGTPPRKAALPGYCSPC